MQTKQIENNPGAVEYGNFINYYQFNKAEERFALLPKDIWLPTDVTSESRPYLVLDVGCNTGELTQQLYQHIAESAQGRKVYILAVDLDATLILRAQQNNQVGEHIKYVCVNCMHFEELQKILAEFLLTWQRQKFDAICCFSITMWIHLNHDDAGLQAFLTYFSQQTDLLLVEPQPWKCYQTAQRRLRRAGKEFKLFLKLKWRSEVEREIDDYLQNVLKMRRVLATERTRWQRSLYFYRW